MLNKCFAPLLLLFASLSIITSGCNEAREEDAGEVAEKVNDQKLRDKEAERDAQFLVDAATSFYDQERMADVALTNGAGEPIKALAKQLKDSADKNTGSLKSLAGPKAITLPAAGSESVLQDAGKMIDNTSKDFNKQWLQRMQKLQESQVNSFQRATEASRDTSIREWFGRHLPMALQQKQLIDSLAVSIPR